MNSSQEHYYDEFTAAVYDQEYSVNKEEILFYMNIAEHTGGPILELGCGTGAILLPLVEKGFTVVGVDSSEFMLNVLKRKIERVNNKNKLKITLFKSRMEDFETSHQFNLIIIANNTFLHLNQFEKMHLLKKLPRLLSPEGIAVIDIFNPNRNELLLTDLYYMRGYPVFYKDNMYLVNASTRHVSSEQKLIIQKEYHQVSEFGVLNEEPFRTSFELFYLSKEQFEKLVKSIGTLKIQAIYGNYQKARYTEKSQRMIFILTHNNSIQSK